MDKFTQKFTPTVQVFTRNSQGLPVVGFAFSKTPRVSSKVLGPKVLVLGGVHGDEPEGIAAAWGLIDSCYGSMPDVELLIMPVFNPYGAMHARRQNAAGVDLNRNLPSQDWSPQPTKPKYQPGPKPASEPETQALVQHLAQAQTRPDIIISLHSWHPMLNTNGDCSPVVERIAEVTGYKITPDIGYPTPGSLGAYCQELGVPCLTYEIERGLALERVILQHVPALQEGLKAMAKGRT